MLPKPFFQFSTIALSAGDPSNRGRPAKGYGADVFGEKAAPYALRKLSLHWSQASARPFGSNRPGESANAAANRSACRRPRLKAAKPPIEKPATPRPAGFA